MSIEKVSSYVTYDGASFADRQAAAKHEDTLTLNGILNAEVQAQLKAAGFSVIKTPKPRAKKAAAA